MRSKARDAWSIFVQVVNINRPYILKSLVGVSLMLLFIFLSYWNFENYKREKEELRQDLTNQMALACSEYRDSVVQEIFSFVSFDEDSLGVGFDLTSLVQHEINGSGSQSFVLRTSRSDSVGQKHTVKDTMITVIVESDDPLHERDGIIAWRDERSTSLRVEFIEDTINDRLVVFDEPLSDTTILKRKRNFFDVPNVYKKIDSIYSRLLVKSDILLPHEVVIQHTNDVPDRSKMEIVFDYESFGQRAKPIAVFADYKSYIWRKLSPSLLMSLTLFTVVAASFITILNSWLAQMRLTKVKNEFVSNMTHELKTPISTIGVALEALENFGALEDVKRRTEYLEISKHEVNRLGILVDKVLKMSKLDQGEESLRLARVDMRELTDAMLKSMKLHLDKNDAFLEYKVVGGDFIVSGDKIHLTNVLYNLIDNAIKYAKTRPEISVILSSNKEDVTVTISDKGIGIPQEYQSKVFNRFFRVPTGDRHNVKGHGLGLHYVDAIIRKHKGSVSIESEEEVGTIFIIKIPRIND